MLFLKQPDNLTFLCHESATTCRIDLYKVPNSKLKPDLCSCAKIEIIESTAPPQQGSLSHCLSVHLQEL